MLFSELKPHSRLTHPDYPGVTVTVIDKTENRVSVATGFRIVSFYKPEFEAQPFEPVAEPETKKK